MTKAAQNGKCQKNAQAERDDLDIDLDSRSLDPEHKANVKYLADVIMDKPARRDSDGCEISDAEHKKRVRFLKEWVWEKLEEEYGGPDPIEEIRNRSFWDYLLDSFTPPFLLETRVPMGEEGRIRDIINTKKRYDKMIGRFRDEAGI